MSVPQYHIFSCRLYSDYLYFASANKSAEDFHEKVAESLQLFEGCVLDFSLRACVYNNTLNNAMPVRIPCCKSCPDTKFPLNQNFLPLCLFMEDGNINVSGAVGVRCLLSLFPGDASRDHSALLLCRCMESTSGEDLISCALCRCLQKSSSGKDLCGTKLAQNQNKLCSFVRDGYQ